MIHIVPDRDQAEHFLRLLDPCATSFTFQTFDDDKERRNQLLARVLHGTLDENWDKLVALNKQNAGIFITVNETDGHGRRIENIERVRALFADLDGAPLDPVKQSELPPHLMIESSPGRWQTYWLAAIGGIKREQFSALQKALAAKYGGDDVHDLPRVMRLPGFFHRKGDPHLVRIVATTVARAVIAEHFDDIDQATLEEDAGRGTAAEEPSPWKQLNDQALANLKLWVPEIFPTARPYHDGYRVKSTDLGRKNEEDLSLVSEGIKDFGVHDIGDEREGKRTPIDIVMEHGQKDFNGAVEWLRSRLTGSSTSDTENNSEKAQTSQQPPSEVVIVCASDVEAKKINWLWKPRIACGKLTLLVGMPDVSKSTLSCDITARVTHGNDLPNGEGQAPIGSVIILSAEDDVADTIRPRLEVAGADLTRVHVITAVRVKQGPRRNFNLMEDMERLEREVRRIGDVVLIIIDPFSAYMGKPGKLDSYRSTDVRSVLAPLQEMAARYGAAIIGIGHLNKSGSSPAMMRVLDSVAFVAASRGVYLVVRDPEDEDRRLFLPVKNNIGKIRTGLAFRIIEKLAPPPVFDAYPAIKWEDGAVNMTADEALVFKQDGRRSEAMEKAKVLIQEMLTNGPARQPDIQARAEGQQIGSKSLRNAKQDLGIVSTRIEGVWWWSLPSQPRPM